MPANEPNRRDYDMRRTLLIVDERDDVRAQIRDALSDKFDLLESESMEQGLQTIRKYKDRISLILLAMELSHGRTYAFLESLREFPGCGDIPVVVHTEARDTGAESKCLELGAVDFLAKPFDPRVTRAKIRNMINLRETSALLNAVEHDDLTGLFTRAAFIRHLDAHLAKAPGNYELVIADISDFKGINERYGTAGADNILRGIGKYLSAYQPTLPLTGRYGGDRFAVLCPEDIRSDLTEGLQNLLNELIPDRSVSAFFKFGIYPGPDAATPATILCDRTMTAMRSEKHKYGSRLGIYNSELENRISRRRTIEHSMHKALRDNEFRIYYQPKHNVETGELIGAEALIRWQHPEFGFMSPSEFIPLFESNGFITEADTYVWNHTCEKLRDWIDKGIACVPVSVNISRLDLLTPDFHHRLAETVAHYRLNPEYLHIEVTESLFTDRVRELTLLLAKLRSNGFHIELDDFGSGYSSLFMLATLPLDVVKLDMSLMQNVHDERRRRILTSCIQLANSLNLKTVVEGVETSEQLNILKYLGAGAVQGYFYSKPLPEAEFEEYLISHACSMRPENDDSANHAEESGFYMIDADHNLVGFNDAAKRVYPNLCEGRKCYECIRHTDMPCPEGECVMTRPGSRIHWNSILNMYESCDVVHSTIRGIGPCRSVTFSAGSSRDAFALKFSGTNTRDRNLELIRALASDYENVFSINLTTREFTVHTYKYATPGVRRLIDQNTDYKTVMQYYAEHSIVPEDREGFIAAVDPEHIMDRLQTTRAFTHIYRVQSESGITTLGIKFLRMDSEYFENSIVLAMHVVENH